MSKNTYYKTKKDLEFYKLVIIYIFLLFLTYFDVKYQIKLKTNA